MDFLIGGIEIFHLGFVKAISDHAVNMDKKIGEHNSPSLSEELTLPSLNVI